MKTHNIQDVEIFIPESWSDVSFQSYMIYLKKIKPLGYSPSRLRLMDAVNGDVASHIFNEQPDMIIDLGFIYDGPPAIKKPTKIDLGILTADINLPIRFDSTKQIEDLNTLSVGLFPMDNLQRLEQGSAFCSLYCQTLINPNYDREEALKLIDNVNRAPVEQVLNLYAHVMLALVEVNANKEALARRQAELINNLNTRLN